MVPAVEESRCAGGRSMAPAGGRLAERGGALDAAWMGATMVGTAISSEGWRVGAASSARTGTDGAAGASNVDAEGSGAKCAHGRSSTELDVAPLSGA